MNTPPRPPLDQQGIGPRRRSPILVTGMPRSGTTWLARLLALAPGAALPGREPLNPRGRQYALSGSVQGWVRLTQPTPKQRRALWLSHRALTPWAYSRYGVRQWAAPLPWSQIVVKDPFALLSTKTVHEITGALPVVVYRHPGAMLTSYRRMGWLPDLDELAPIVRSYERDREPSDPMIPALPADVEPASAAAMGWFWAALYAMAIADVRKTPCALIVSHEQLASDLTACQRLYDHLDLRWNTAAEAEVTREGSGPTAMNQLHNLRRSPAEVATAWRKHLSPSEIDEIEDVTAEVQALIEDTTADLGDRRDGPS